MLNLFLQAFDEGWVTDGRGKRVYLSDAIVIMTSNIGSECFRKLSSPLGFYSKQVGVEQVQGEITRELERRFTPEFRNRIDDVIVFRPLSKDEVPNRLSRSARSRSRRQEPPPAAFSRGPRALVTEGKPAYGARFSRGHREPNKAPYQQRWSEGRGFPAAAGRQDRDG